MYVKTMLRLNYSLKHVCSGCLKAVLSGFVVVVLKAFPYPTPCLSVGCL